MKLRLALTAVVALVGVLVVSPSALAASPSASLGAVAVSGKDNVGAKRGKFKGTYRVTDVRLTSKGLVTVGTVRGVVTDRKGRRAKVVRRNVQAVVSRPAQSSQLGGTCRILFLDIQPINLNLLGLRIQVSRITINITGERGAGNLLGNLLCGLLGLADQFGLPTLANLLAQLGPQGIANLLALIQQLGGGQTGLQNLINLLNLLSQVRGP